MSDFESDCDFDSSGEDPKDVEIDLPNSDEEDFGEGSKKKTKPKKTDTPKKKETKSTPKKAPARSRKAKSDDDEDDKPPPVKRSRAKKVSGDEPKGKKSKNEEPSIPDSQAPNFVMNYINEQNRPFNAINLFENLHRRVKKATLTKVLDDLSAKGKIKEKAFGKFRFFFADQAQYGEIAESELDKLDDEIEELKEKEEKLKSEVSKLESETKLLENSLPTDQLESTVASLIKRVADKTSRVKVLRESREEIPADLYINLKGELKKCLQLWNKRKSCLGEVVNSLSDGMDKDPEEIREMLGIETDEEYNINYKDIKTKYDS